MMHWVKAKHGVKGARRVKVKVRESSMDAVGYAGRTVTPSGSVLRVVERVKANQRIGSVIIAARRVILRRSVRRIQRVKAKGMEVRVRGSTESKRALGVTGKEAMSSSSSSSISSCSSSSSSSNSGSSQRQCHHG